LGTWQTNSDKDAEQVTINFDARRPSKNEE
jgi:hypothetical protein